MNTEGCELHEMAAKAAGYQVEWVRNSGCYYRCEEEIGREQFCPQDDDGDAFRLLDVLRLSIECASGAVRAYRKQDDGSWISGETISLQFEGSPYREAIFTAAVAIGRAMP